MISKNKKVISVIVSIIMVPLFLLILWVSVNAFYHKAVPELLWKSEEVEGKYPLNSQNGLIMILEDYEANPERYEHSDTDIVNREFFDISPATFFGDESKAQPSLKNICARIKEKEDLFKKSIPDVYNTYLKGLRYNNFLKTVEFDNPFRKFPMLSLLDLSRIAEVNVLISACHGDYLAAAELLGLMIKANIPLNRSPNLLATMIALTSLNEDIQIAKFLLTKPLSKEETNTTKKEEARKKLLSILKQADFEELSAKSGIVGEYLFFINALTKLQNNFDQLSYSMELDDMQKELSKETDVAKLNEKAAEIKKVNQKLIEAGKIKKDTFDIRSWFFDYGSTLSAINNHFKCLSKIVSQPSGAVEKYKCEIPRYHRVGLWFFNPIGKICLNRMVSLEERIILYNETVNGIRETVNNLISKGD